MRKITATILSLFSLTALSSATAAGLITQKTPILANADAKQPTATETLFAPTDYEQYLQLTTPTDVAANDHYVAISEATTIFVFSRD